MYEAHRAENNRGGVALAQEVGVTGYSLPPNPQKGFTGAWVPGLSQLTPQLMGLKGKGCRAGLSEKDRKKQGEEGEGQDSARVGGLSRPSSATPRPGLREVGPLLLSPGCPLLHPPTGPHPRIHHPHLKWKCRVVSSAARAKVTSSHQLPNISSRQWVSWTPSFQIRTLRLGQARFHPGPLRGALSPGTVSCVDPPDSEKLSLPPTTHRSILKTRSK